jgi:hypothetical protein
MCDELKAAGTDAVERHKKDVSLREDEIRKVESELSISVLGTAVINNNNKQSKSKALQ